RRLSSSARTISGSSSTIRILGIYTSRAERQVEGKSATRGVPAAHAHAAAVGLGDVLDQRQPHPAPAPPLGLVPSDAVVLLENSLDLGRRAADPLVGPLDAHLGAGPA